jgi:exodeoxyribonuclease VII large subunit
MRRQLTALWQTLLQHERGLARSHPGARLRQHAQRLDELEQRMQHAMQRRLERARVRVANATVLLSRSSPARRLAPLRQRLDAAGRRLPLAVRRRLQHSRERWERAMHTLHAVSPLATLDRGYAIVTDAAAHVVTDAAALKPGEEIEARLARGSVRAQVTHVSGPATSKE